ncbi:MAG: nicotinate-nucleotide--dimethylbenzimidazole phosphoribosyltransferase, partial [Ilumatobacteraceae bacterium]
MTWLVEALTSMPAGDRDAADAVRTRAADILRPAGALARLDDVAAWVAEWQGTLAPAVHKPAALIFAADHG